MDCEYTLNRLIEAVLTSVRNPCFRAKIRRNVYPCKPQFYYIKVEEQSDQGLHCLLFKILICIKDFVQNTLRFGLLV